MTFREVQLQDVLDIQWGDTKTTKASYVPDGHLAYSATGPDGFLEKFDYDREGIVLSAIGANCGSTFFATGKWSCIKNTIRILPKNDDIDLKFFFYMTKAPHFWPIRGSAQPFISQTDIRELYVQIPDISVQKAIGKILFELEEKISANNVLSKTLEDIAQSIFKSWFIDFDPVKAKMAGEKPVGMDAATAALFPDSMVESGHGLIPKSWEVVTLEHLAQISKKSVNPQSNASTKFSHYSIPAFDSGLYPTYVAGEKILSGKFVIDRPSVLVSKLNPQTQRIWTVTKPHNHAICSTEFIVLTTFLEESFSFINQVVKSVSFQEAFVGMATGSTGSRQRVRPDEILQVPIVVPNMQVVRAFSDVTFQMIQEIDLIREQNQALMNLRDALLPRLISGELQIPEEMLAS
jgi:type I restriction enzyme S subunit